MKDLFGLILVVGLWAFAVGCGKAQVNEVEAPPPTSEDIEENEAMGATPGE